MRAGTNHLRRAMERSIRLGEEDRVLMLIAEGADEALVRELAAAIGPGQRLDRLRYVPTSSTEPERLACFPGVGLIDDYRAFASVPRAYGAIELADVALVIGPDISPMFDQEFRSLVAGARAWMLPYLDWAAVDRTLPRTDKALGDTIDRTVELGDAVGAATSATVISGAGHRLEMTLGEFKTNVSTGVTGAGGGYGGIEVWPGGQVSRVPNTSSTNGSVVIDRSIADPAFRRVEQELVIHVEDGLVVDVAGGGDASKLRSFLTDYERTTWRLTELGCGTNELCHAVAAQNPLEDTHARGVVSLAIGADTHLGGPARGPFHIDMTIRAATLLLDGEAVVDDGRLALQAGGS